MYRVLTDRLLSGMSAYVCVFLYRCCDHRDLGVMSRLQRQLGIGARLTLAAAAARVSSASPASSPAGAAGPCALALRLGEMAGARHGRAHQTDGAIGLGKQAVLKSGELELQMGCRNTNWAEKSAVCAVGDVGHGAGVSVFG